MAKPKITRYSPLEVKLNVYSHALGFVLSLVGTYFLMAKAVELSSALHFWSYGVFMASLIVLYAASTLYHHATNDERRKRLNIIDHAAIYFLIAGTYIPYALIGIGGQWGWVISIIVSIIGLTGIILKIFFTGRFKLASTISYVLMGCVVFIATKPLLAKLSQEALNYLFIGGGFYLIGAFLYSIKKIPYNHAIFHLFVLGGSLFQYLGVLLYI